LLRQIGEYLVEIHGQNDTHGLLNAQTHRELLDLYGRIDGPALQMLWNDWQDTQDVFHTARNEAAILRQEETYLRESLEDLETLAPKSGEEAHLSGLRERLMHRDQTLESLQSAYALLFSEGGCESRLGQAARILERAATKAGEAEFQPLMDSLSRMELECREAMISLQSLSAEYEGGDTDLTGIEDRLYALKAQARKHGCLIDELPQVQNDLARRLFNIENMDEHLAGLARRAETARAAYLTYAKDIQQKRKRAAAEMDLAIHSELPPLKLEKARFQTMIEELPESQWGPYGLDRVEFLVATNPGSDPGPLGKIASGGEMSRFTLALKMVLANTGTASTLIFDEVDAGIGGATASAVGERLSRLGIGRQILVVTHSPQVAARADHHYVVRKNGENIVRTEVEKLMTMEMKMEEIARMLSGDRITEEARAAARSLMRA